MMTPPPGHTHSCGSLPAGPHRGLAAKPSPASPLTFWHRPKMSTLAGPLTGTFEALTVTNVSRRRHPRPLEHTFLTVDGADPFSNPPPMSILPLTRERASPPLNKAARRRPVGPMIAGARRDAEIVRHPRSEERRVGKECRSRWSPYH